MAFGEPFLAALDLPEEGATQAWGSQSCVIDLPGGPYRFSGLSTAQKALIEKAYPRWQATGSGGQVSLIESRFSQIDVSTFLPLDQIRWEKLIDVDCQRDVVQLAGYPWRATIALADRPRGIVWTPVEAGPAFADLVENYFRVLVAYRLLLGGSGLLIHSAGLSDGRGGYLFAGRSGAGKSTLSRLALGSGLEVLSDDGNALLLTDGIERHPVITALPFGGDLRPRHVPKGRYPLRAVSALAKGENHLEPLPKAAAVALLVACAPFVNGDPHRFDLLLERAVEAVGQVSTHRLTFSRQGGFWSLFEPSLAPSAATGRPASSLSSATTF